MRNKKAIKIIIILLSISIIALISCIIYDVRSYYKNKSQEKQLVEEIEKIIVDIDKEREQDKEQITQEINQNEDEKTVVLSDNKKAYGIIKIDKINLKQPILEYNELNFKNSICNLLNTEITAENNIYLVGHNMRNGTVFGKLKKLSIGDIVEITNINGECYQYTVSRIMETDSTSDDIYGSEENELLTLITCTSSGKKKLVIKAAITPKGTGDFGGE